MSTQDWDEQAGASERARIGLARLDMQMKYLEEHLPPTHLGAFATLVGSISEGFSTRSSDIDILVVYPLGSFPRQPTFAEILRGGNFYFRDGDASFPRSNSMIVNRRLSGGQKLQFELIGAERFIELQDNILMRLVSVRDRIDGRAGSEHRLGVLPRVEERVLLHRFYTGLPLSGESTRDSLVPRMPLSALADVVAILKLFSVRAGLSDLEGDTHGRPDRAAIITNLVVLELAGLVLASCGETNARDKFAGALLARHAHRIGPEVVDLLSDALVNPPPVAAGGSATIFELATKVVTRAQVLCPLLREEASASLREGVTAGIVGLKAVSS